MTDQMITQCSCRRLSNREKFISLLFLSFIFVTSGVVKAQSWNLLYDRAIRYGEASALDSATALGVEALEKAESDNSARESDIADILQFVADLHFRRNRIDEANQFYKRAFEIRRRSLGPDDLKTKESEAGELSTSGLMATYEGEFPQGEACLRRALVLKTEIYGHNEPEVGRSLMHLGNHFSQRGQFFLAEEYYKEALTCFVKESKAVGYLKAMTLNNLGGTYLVQGRYVEAEESLTEAIQVWTSVLGPSDPFVNIPRAQLAGLYQTTGHFEKARETWETALNMSVAATGEESTDVGSCLTNLSYVYDAMNMPQASLRCLQRAMKIASLEQSKEDESFLHPLAEAFREHGMNAQAESLYLKSWTVFQQEREENHRHAKIVLLDLASLYGQAGDCARADSIFQVLDSLPNVRSGIDEAFKASYLETQSSCLRAERSYRKAFMRASEAFAMRYPTVRATITAMSEQAGWLYAEYLRRSGSILLSCFMDLHSDDASANEQAAKVVWSLKGLLTDAMFLRWKILLNDADSTSQVLGELYSHAVDRLSRYELDMENEANHDVVDSLREAVDQLGTELARRSQPIAGMMKEYDFNDGAAASLIPDDGVLVEYIKYDYQGIHSGNVEPHYAVSVLERSGVVHVLDLGRADVIDTLVGKYRHHLLSIGGDLSKVTSSTQREYNSFASELASLLLTPLSRFIKGSRILLISPDDALNLVSFAGLVTSNGRYLVEEYQIHYLSSGRDLVRLSGVHAHGKGLLALGNPDFDSAVPEDHPGTVRIRSGDSSSSDCSKLRRGEIGRLPGTGEEISVVASHWDSLHGNEPAELFQGSRASEELLKKYAPGMRVVHVATHGFFLSGACVRSLHKRSLQHREIFAENALLRSGLLLAGVNSETDRSRDDGILTSMEVSGMNFKKTELVVLSACESGLGDLMQGEGVYGLRRAFQLAGARTIVSSLWQIPDQGTERFMEDFYLQRENATSYPALLQDLALKRIRELRVRNRPTHPLLWGAFVTTGEWRVR